MKKGFVEAPTAGHGAATPSTPVSAEGSNASQERASTPVHVMRRRRKKKKSKPASPKKRRRGVSMASNALGCSIIADAATLGDEETPTRRPDKSLSQEAQVTRRVSVLTPSTLTERPSAFNTAQSSMSPFKSAVASPQSDTNPAVCEPRRKASLRCSLTETPQIASEALTISAEGIPSERKTPPHMKRTQSRGALTTVTFGRTSLTTLLPDTTPSPRVSPGLGGAFGGSRARTTATHHRRRSILLPRGTTPIREPSTVDTGIMPSGLHRVGLQTCALVSLGVLTFHWLAMPLLAPPVDHWCSKPPEAGNLSDAHWKNAAIPVRRDGRFSQCTVYSLLPPVLTNESADYVPAISRVERNCTAWDYDLAPGVKTMTNEWNMVCDRRRQVLVAVVYNNLGGLMAMPFVGQMADRLGRWTVEAGSLVVSLLAAAATVSTTDFSNFVIARMLLTGSLGALSLAMAVAMFEASYSQRQRQVSVCFAHLVVSLVALLPRLMGAMVLDRRAVCLAVLLCAFTMLVMVLAGVDESPRWMRALFDASNVVDSKAPTSGTAINRFTRGVSSLLARKYSKLVRKYSAQVRKQPTVSSLGLLLDQALRTRTLALAFTLFALLNSLPSYADEDAPSVERLNDVTRPMLRVCSIVAADQLLRERTRREALLLALPCVCLLVCAEAVAEATAAQYTLPLIRELLLNSILANLTMVCVYCLELYPTSARATGLGSVYFAGGVCATASPLLLALRLERPLLQMSTVPFTVAAMFVVMLLPETKDTQLPETLFDLEGHARRLGSTEVDDLMPEPDTSTEMPCRSHQPQPDHAHTAVSAPLSSTVSSVHALCE